MKLQLVDESLIVPIKLKNTDEYLHLDKHTVITGNPYERFDEESLKQAIAKGLVRIVYDNPREKFLNK